MMRNIFCLLLLTFLMSCQNDTTKKEVESTSEKMEKTPVQWVTYKGKGNKANKKIILVTGDEEYRSEEAMPQMARILADHHGFDCTVLFAQHPENLGTIDPNYRHNIPGLEMAKDADLMILMTRFRELPNEQMQHINSFLEAGKPIIAIRTATHAFNIKEDSHPFKHYTYNYKGDKAAWEMGFGKTILGETWYTHHGHHKHQSTRGIIAAGAENHPIINGIENGAIWGATDVYGIRMPMPNTQSILLGQTINRAGEFDKEDLLYGMKETDTEVATKRSGVDESKTYNPNDPMPPIAWTKNYQIPNGQAGKSFASTIGSSTDLLDEDIRRMFVNATYYLLDKEVPAKAKVDLVGKYEPTSFSFHTDEYWKEKNLQVASYVE